MSTKAGVDNSGSASFTPDASLAQFDQLELVLTDADDNTVTSDAFSIDGGASQNAANQRGGNGRVSASSERGSGRQSANEDGADESESELQVPGGVAQQGAGRVSAAVEPPETDAQGGAGGRGGNNNQAGANNAANIGPPPPGTFVAPDPAALTITPTIPGTPAVFITDPAQLATNGVTPNVGVINGQPPQATGNVNIQTVPAASDAAGVGAGVASPVQLSPVATPSAAVIDPVC